VGYVWLPDSPFSLVASLFEHAETGNSTITNYVRISWHKITVFWRQNDVVVIFVAICGIQTIWQKLGLTFSRKFESCFIEIQYQVTRRRHLLNKQTNRNP